MNWRICAGVACAAALALGVPTLAAIRDDAGIQRVQEDEAGWDCLTMGNRTCGSAFYICHAEPEQLNCQPKAPRWRLARAVDACNSDGAIEAYGLWRTDNHGWLQCLDDYAAMKGWH